MGPKLLVPPPPRLVMILLLLIATTLIKADEDLIAAESNIQQQKQQQLPPVYVPIVAQFPDKNDSRLAKIGDFRFNHLIVDPKSGYLFAGAVNRLFKLDSSLQLDDVVVTGV